MTLSTSLAKARIRTHMQLERLLDPHPKSLRSVPLSADSITREWLTKALCGHSPGAQITGFELGARDTGTTSRREIRIQYNKAGRRAGLPETLFAKSTVEFASRYVCGLSGAIASEVGFYNHIRPLLAIETPVCHYAAFEPGSFRSIFLFEDAKVTKQAVFLNPRHRPTQMQAEDMVRVMARLHARFWDDPILDREFTWIKDALAYQHHINQLIGFGERCALGLARAASVLPPRLAARRAELWPALLRSCERRIQPPRTLLHADIHIGNWYVTGKGEMGLCDWQCTTKGSWAADFAYAVSSSLEPDERRAWERGLLELYLDTLELPAGKRKPSFDEAWTSYRQQTLHGLYNWLFVAGIGAGQTEMHSDQIWRSNLTRMGTAVDDLETLDS